eukprot:TRINITY_DN1317_c0_g1_i5.p1 TRINITY_DN1317_c0_g1~~TRINITY_DN1317_c0_g1_i5.p1  ORF type:complete len:440 (-),score=69.20 TRINITY_DN1317_c0_g1_i5:1-1320(-)
MKDVAQVLDTYGSKINWMVNPKQDSVISNHVAHHFIKMSYCKSETTRTFFCTNEGKLFSYFLSRVIHKAKDHSERRDILNELSSRLRQILGETCEARAYEIFDDAIQIEERGLLENKENLKYLKMIASSSFIMRCPFELASSILHTYDIVLEKGYAYFPFNFNDEFLLDLFVQPLKQILMSQLLTLHHKVDDIFKNHLELGFLRNLDVKYTGPAYLDEKNISNITADNVHVFARKHFPLCMRELFDKLLEDSHLKHFGRLQFGLFLKGTGLTIDESLRFWKGIFSRRLNESDFDKKYAYNIRHSYGEEGKKADYYPWTCTKILNNDPRSHDEHHGCPFKVYGGDNLKKALGKYPLPVDDIEDIMKKRDGKHYQLACSTMFQVLHPNGPDFTVEHPNKYFNESYKYDTRKIHANSGRKGPSSSAPRGSQESFTPRDKIHH